MLESLSSTVLLLGIFNAAIVATLLLLKRSFKPATIVLVVFMLLLLARSILYVLGKENLFDPHSWLYVPLTEVSLAYGPCIYLYLIYSVRRSFHTGDLLHFAPVITQVFYYLLLLLLPTSSSISLIENFHNPIFIKIETFAVMLSLGGYLFLTWRNYYQYQLWLDEQHSDADDFRMDWLRIFLISTAVFFLFWLSFTLKGIWGEQTFESNFKFFAIQSLLLCLLAFESWRNAELVYPQQARITSTVLAIPEIANSSELDNLAIKPKVNQQACEWIRLLKENEWWRDPHLTLAGLAVKLGTNSTSLSAAINQQCGENFNAAINRLRVDYICDQIAQYPNQNGLLALAYDAGFNSKNSFNRNFRRFTGHSPSEFRQQLSTKS